MVAAHAMGMGVDWHCPRNILTTATHGRFIYWEYEDDYDTIVQALKEHGLLIN